MGKLRQGQVEQRPEPRAGPGTLLPVRRDWGQPAHPGVLQLTSSSTDAVPTPALHPPGFLWGLALCITSPGFTVKWGE